jgi:hypothetical protein
MFSNSGNDNLNLVDDWMTMRKLRNQIIQEYIAEH